MLYKLKQLGHNKCQREIPARGKERTMSEKIELTFDPLGRGEVVSIEEAYKSLHDIYLKFVEAGFTKNDALTLVAKLIVTPPKN